MSTLNIMLKASAEGFQKVGSEISSLKTTILGVAAALGVMKIASAAFGQFKAGVADAMQLEKTIMQLKVTVASYGKDVEAAFGKMEAFATQMANQSTLSADQILTLQNQALQYSRNTEHVESMTMAAMALNKALGLGTDTAMRGLSQTLSGQTSVLSRYVPQIKNMTKEQLRSGEAIKILAEQYAPSLAAELLTLSGQVERSSNTLKDYRQEIGRSITNNAAFVAGMKKIGDILFENLPSSAALRDTMAQLADKVLAFTSFMVAGASSIGKAFATIISAASTYAGVFIGMIKSIVEGYRTIWKIIGKDDNILVEYADKAIAGLDSVQTGLADMARGADKSGESIEDFALLADSALTRVRNAMSAAGHGAVELGENFDSAGKALDKFWGEDDLKALKASVAEGLKIYDHNLSEREKAEQLYASKIEEMRAGQSEYAIALDKKMAASADKLAKSREQSMQKYATIATGLLTSVIDDAMSGEKSFGQIMAGVASRSMQIIIQQVQASVMARMIDAMANAASSQAMIPFIGPILAVAAVGAMGSLFAGLLGKIASPPKFHSGGVVPGSPSQERLVLARGQERFLPPGTPGPSPTVTGQAPTINLQVMPGAYDKAETERHFLKVYVPVLKDLYRSGHLDFLRA